MHMDQLKKHTIIAHNGHKNTTWMLCGDWEYATRVEKETEKAKRETREVETWGQTQSEEDDEDDETPVSKTGLGNYYPNPMNCGDCSFETHYEN